MLIAKLRVEKQLVKTIYPENMKALRQEIPKILAISSRRDGEMNGRLKDGKWDS